MAELAPFEHHAMVTGAGSGIGAAVAAALVESGIRVTLLGRNADKLGAVAGPLAASCQVADVTCLEEVQLACRAAVDQHGPIDILINNAGAAQAASFVSMDDQLWHDLLAVNLTGVYHCIKTVAPAMLEAGFGRIVNVASTAGLTGYAYVSAYCAAKHGVVGLTRALAQEFARQGVTVNAVCPGYTDTDMVQRSIDQIVAKTGRTRDQALAELTKLNPQGRLVTPSEVAATVVWLCRSDAASINGQAIAVAGGEVM